MDETASWLAAAEAAFRAFDGEVQRDVPELTDRYTALFGEDPAAFRRIFESAAGRGDMKTVAVLGDILERHDAHDWNSRIAYATALLHEERYEAATAVFERLRPLRSTRVVYGRARALAGEGRLEEALAAAEDALLARPDHALSETLRDRLLIIIPLHARRAELRNWREIHALFEGYMALGLKAQAKALLTRVMGDPASTELSIAQRLSAGELALRVCAPEDVREYVTRVPPKYPDRSRALRTAANVLAGIAPLHGETLTPEADKGLRTWTALSHETAGDLPGAVHQLSALAEEFKRDPYIRGELARTVGRAVLEEVRPQFAAGGLGKVINLVMFNNEFALLRMHLEEMTPFVDRFVIVEAGQTFMGGDKPLHFQENREQFADFADRIVHITLPRFPAHVATAWARDFHQRDAAIAAAQDLCGQDDYILITDTDEIIAPHALDGFTGDFACLQLMVSRFFLNYRMKPGAARAFRPAAAIFKARHLEKHGLSYARFFLARRSSSAYVIPDAGWHFTSVNDADRIALKLGSYAHQEQTKTQFKTPDHFREMLERIRAGEVDPGWERVELDDHLPPYIRRNREALAHLIL